METSGINSTGYSFLGRGTSSDDSGVVLYLPLLNHHQLLQTEERYAWNCWDGIYQTNTWPIVFDKAGFITKEFEILKEAVFFQKTVQFRSPLPYLKQNCTNQLHETLIKSIHVIRIEYKKQVYNRYCN